MSLKDNWSIYESYHNGEVVPEGFNAVTVTLDAQMNASLDWKEAIDVARQYIYEGKSILWKIDFGLFDRLVYPLQNETQFLSLTLGIDHFIKNIWEPFSDHTLGVSIYEGSIDFASDFFWSEDQHLNFQEWLRHHVQDFNILCEELELDIGSLESIFPGMLYRTENGTQLLRLYCRDACSDYMILLRERFPDECRVMSLIDVESITHMGHLLHLINPERFERVELVLKGKQLPNQSLGWSDTVGERGYISREKMPFLENHLVRIGVHLPSGKVCHQHHYIELERALCDFHQKGVAYKLIPEEYLTYEWDGLDYMLVQSDLVSSSGRRKLLGFCAAGGTVLTLGEMLGLPIEETYKFGMQNEKS